MGNAISMGSLFLACSASGAWVRALGVLVECMRLGLGLGIDSYSILLMQCEQHGFAHTEAVVLSSLGKICSNQVGHNSVVPDRFVDRALPAIAGNCGQQSESES